MDQPHGEGQVAAENQTGQSCIHVSVHMNDIKFWTNITARHEACA